MTDQLTLVDVGARGGIHTRWQPYYDRLNVIAFEPDPEECARLNAQTFPYRARHLPVALGANNGEQVRLHITRAPDCSSVLEPNLGFVLRYPFGPQMEVVSTIPVTLQRMDSIITEPVHAMKIDTQGTELHVLQGAGKLLDSCLAVELEVEFNPQYVGQPLFSDVDIFMRSKGFELQSYRRTFWRLAGHHGSAKGGKLIHGDALYFRPEISMSENGRLILAAYEQHDMLSHAGGRHLIKRVPKFKEWLGSLWPNRELRRLVDSFRPSHATDWQDPEFF